MAAKGQMIEYLPWLFITAHSLLFSLHITPVLQQFLDLNRLILPDSIHKIQNSMFYMVNVKICK